MYSFVLYKDWLVVFIIQYLSDFNQEKRRTLVKKGGKKPKYFYDVGYIYSRTVDIFFMSFFCVHCFLLDDLPNEVAQIISIIYFFLVMLKGFGRLLGILAFFYYYSMVDYHKFEVNEQFLNAPQNDNHRDYGGVRLLWWIIIFGHCFIAFIGIILSGLRFSNEVHYFFFY